MAGFCLSTLARRCSGIVDARLRKCGVLCLDVLKRQPQDDDGNDQRDRERNTGDILQGETERQDGFHGWTIATRHSYSYRTG